MTESGIVKLLNEQQDWNALFPIVSNFSLKVTVSNTMHKENVYDLIDVTKSGITIFSVKYMNEMHVIQMM